MNSLETINTGNSIPTVSIFIMVYNHGDYLEQTLLGILNQQCDFDFEIVVGEDCSKDNSRQILLDYANKHPGKFRLLLHETNVGPGKNHEMVMANCIGKYTAMCEGDDYWIDPLKLQKQIDFLENNPEFAMVHTGFKKFNESDKTFETLTMHYDDSNVFNKLLKDEYHVGTLTTVFRKEIYEKYLTAVAPDTKQWLMGDLPIWLYMSKFHKIHFIKDVTAVYRVLEESASNTKDINKILRFTDSANEIKMFFINNYVENNKAIKRRVANWSNYRRLVVFAQFKGDLKTFFKMFMKFHIANRNFLFFIGSFKQMFLRLR